MLRVSRDEALHDALTGLPTGARSRAHLDRAIPRASTTRPLVLVAVRPGRLQALQRHLRPPGRRRSAGPPRGRTWPPTWTGAAPPTGWAATSSVPSSSPASRWPSRSWPARPTRSRSSGEGFSISCSYGSIVLPLEADDAAEALRIADRRMYTQKNAGRTSASRQSRDVLVRALAERNPDLSSHMHDVADLAERTARRLALAEEAVASVRHAAELHDVGKVAIPDEILCKPGPLTHERVRVHPQPHADRRAHHLGGARADRGGQDRALQPRALGRQGLSRCAERRRHPAGFTHHLRGRLLRCHDFGAPLQHPPLARRRL